MSETTNIAGATDLPAKPGRYFIRPILKGPDCKVCSHLDTNRIGPARCRNGRILDATNCPDYDDTSKERPMLGGTSGVVYQR